MQLFLWLVAFLVVLSGGAPPTPVMARAQAPAPGPQPSTAPRSVVLAQAPARDSSALPSGTASISGRVVTTDDAPLRRVQVHLAGGPFTAANAPTVGTNAQGQYEFKNLPAGRYTLTGAKG